MTQRAKRYNKGKLRFELIPTRPLSMIAEVYSKGAHKYTVYQDENGDKILGKDIPFEDVASRKLTVFDDGSDNWRLGQPWIESLASVKRHITEWESGHDRDPELGTHLLANAAWGLIALMEYEKTHPELDNRKHTYLNTKRIGLDIDEVLADFVGGLMDKFPGELTERPVYWNDPVLKELFDRVLEDRVFWATLKPKVKELPFEPACYITARPFHMQEITERWLWANGFPKAPVLYAPVGMSKVDLVRGANIDWFVDDRYETFVELNKAGLCCFLMTASHNQRYNVGYRRIHSLNELV